MMILGIIAWAILILVIAFCAVPNFALMLVVSLAFGGLLALGTYWLKRGIKKLIKKLTNEELD